MNFIKSWNDRQIRIREDRYVCLTDMAQACGKNFGHWTTNKSTQSYLDTLSAVIGIPITAQNQSFRALVEIKKGGTPEEQGTWGHRELPDRVRVG